jgi:hypothetical protein
MTIELGHHYRDRISGFTGIATGVADYISGCAQVLIAPPVNDKGEWREGHWFDVQRLEAIDGAPVVLDNSEHPGPDQEAPKR